MDVDGVKRTLRLLNEHIHELSVPVDEAALDLAQARAERYTTPTQTRLAGEPEVNQRAALPALQVER